jgi:hypothetical protein
MINLSHIIHVWRNIAWPKKEVQILKIKWSKFGICMHGDIEKTSNNTLYVTTAKIVQLTIARDIVKRLESFRGISIYIRWQNMYQMIVNPPTSKE